MTTNSKVSVGTASTGVLANSLNRRVAVLVNDSDETIYISLGGSAVLNEGIRLNAAGGLYEINSTNMWKGSVSAISTSGTKNLSYSETTTEEEE